MINDVVIIIIIINITVSKVKRILKIKKGKIAG